MMMMMLLAPVPYVVVFILDDVALLFGRCDRTRCVRDEITGQRQMFCFIVVHGVVEGY